jgi:magnesium transporter
MRIYSIGDEIKETDIREITFNDNNYYWFDLNPEELDDLNYEYFDFEYSSIEECANMSQVAKVDFFDSYTFIVLNALVYTNGVIHPDEFNVFLKKNCIITVSKEEVKIIKDLQNELLNYKTSVFFSKNKSPARIKNNTGNRRVKIIENAI